MGLSDLWGLATQADGLGWHRLAPSGLNRWWHRDRGLVCDSLVLVLGRRATAEGRRGFQPTVGHPAKQSCRGATMESSPRDRRPISFAPMTPAFHRRSATNHSRVIALRGLKPTATVKCRPRRTAARSKISVIGRASSDLRQPGVCCWPPKLCLQDVFVWHELQGYQRTNNLKHIESC